MQTSNTNTSSGHAVSSATSASHDSATATSHTTPTSGGAVISSGGRTHANLGDIKPQDGGSATDDDGPARPTEVRLSNSQRATLPLIFRDRDGNAITAPRVQGSVSSDDPAVARADIVNAGTAVIIHPYSDGQCILTYTNGGLSTSISVTVATPIAASVEFSSPDLHDKSAS